MNNIAISGRAHSVRDRLRRLFENEGVSFDLVLARYAQERFLYRLAASQYRERLVLKGGLLFTAVTDQFGRATRDIDILAAIDNNETSYRDVLKEIIGVSVEDDGVVFNPDSVIVQRIIVQDDEPGMRARLSGTLAAARLTLQIDAGFGDKVLLPEERFVYPVLLEGIPAPIIRAYSIESVLAEKFEAIASLGETNTRYKDYDDIVQLARGRQLQASNLFAAINMTYSTRATNVDQTVSALASERATEKREVAWRSYCFKVHARHALPTLTETLEYLRALWSGIDAYRRDGVDRIWCGSWKIIQ